MSLITMGYGHLTIITMGLGNSVRITRRRYWAQHGKVEFENVPTGIVVSETTPDISVEGEMEKVSTSNIETEVRDV